MEINLTAPIGIDTSYQIVASNIIKALSRSGHELSIFPINPRETVRAHPEDVPFIKNGIEKQQSYNYRAPSIRLWHQHDLAQHVGHGPWINYPIFELDKFSNVELHHLKSSDALFVASQWAKDIIVANDIDVPTYVIPLGTDREIYNESVVPYIPKGRKTIFLNVGKIERRKGHDILIESFRKAFVHTDEVELWMVWNNPFLSYAEVAEWENEYCNGKLGHKVKILPSRYNDPNYQMPRFNHPSELARVMASADCLVQPSRAEGWGLPSLDALSVGLDLITTNYSAHKMYANLANTHLIDIDELEPANDGKWFHGTGNWVKFGAPQMEQLIYWMRHIHEIKQTEGLLLPNKAGIRTAQMLSWDNTANTIINALKGL